MPHVTQCPGCHKSFTPTVSGTGATALCPDCQSSATHLPQAAPAKVRRVGDYELRKKLGEGSFGAVFVAFQPFLKKDFALKVLKPLAGTAVERFLREAQILANMKPHPNIVPVHYAGKSAEGRYYLVSSLIAGGDLAKLILPGGMEPTRAVRLVAQLLDALHHAHAHNVVHRDVKPANAMVDGQDCLYLMDFGVAGWVDRHEQTGEGQQIGTIVYMPPEQINGDLKRIGPGSDQYSAGVVLFELLTGRRPFGAPGMSPIQAMHQIFAEAPPRPSQLRPGLDPELEAACLKAMAKAPEGRFRDCKEFADTLRSWLARRGHAVAPPLAPAAAPPLAPSVARSTARTEPPLTVLPAGPPIVPLPPPPLPPPRSRAVLLVSGALGVALVFALVAGYVVFSRKGSGDDGKPAGVRQRIYEDAKPKK